MVIDLQLLPVYFLWIKRIWKLNHSCFFFFRSNENAYELQINSVFSHNRETCCGQQEPWRRKHQEIFVFRSDFFFIFLMFFLSDLATRTFPEKIGGNKEKLDSKRKIQNGLEAAMETPLRPRSTIGSNFILRRKKQNCWKF